MESEKEFLAKYNMNDYERPSMTADLVAFTIKSEEEDTYRHNPKNELSLLLIKRGNHPFKDHWALPGGFLNSNETIEQCALRESKEETNLTPVSLLSVGVFSDPGRDPRGWVVSNAFVSIISEESINEQAGDDASDAQWFKVSFNQDSEGLYHLLLKLDETELHAVLKETHKAFGKTDFKIIENGMLAFDHAKIIASALSLLRNQAKNFETIFDFLPEKFTLTSLQKVQETIMGISVLPASFRRKIAAFVEETDEYSTGAGHRPAKLFTRKKM